MPKPRSCLIWAKNRLKRGCGSGASAVMTLTVRAVPRAHLLAAGDQAEIDHLGDRAARGRGLIRRRQAGFDKTQQRLGEERVVIGRAMADLHRLPHRFGDAGPGRVDQGAGRRARDEDPRQVEQQRRVLVAAGIESGQRHQQFTAPDVGVADQVEGGIGRDEAVTCRTSATDARRSAGSRARSRTRPGARARRRREPRAWGAAARWYRAAPPPAGRWPPSPGRHRRGRGSAPRASLAAAGGSRNSARPVRRSSGRNAGFASAVL